MLVDVTQSVIAPLAFLILVWVLLMIRRMRKGKP